jgi:transposase
MPYHHAGAPSLPFKANQDRRHRLPKQRHRVTSWATYDAGLRARGSLTVWFSEGAIAAWAAEPRTTRGGQPHYSALAITTALTLRAVFRLALRQTEGLIGSVVHRLGLDLAVPDHTTLSRRAETLEVPRPAPGPGGEPVHLLVDSTGLKLCGPGEWLVEKHGTRTRRGWRKLHLATDADTGRIVASALTDRAVDDGSQVGPLLGQVDGPVASVTADGAYDRDDVYAAVVARHPEAAVIVPPRSNAVPSATAEAAPTRRDRHLETIAERGRLGWQEASGYNRRALVEADISRLKRVMGEALRSRTDGRRGTEVAIAVAALNRMLELGRPEYVRIA